MRFRPSLYNDSEPDYAPCMKRIRTNYYWVAPAKYKDAGYSIKTYRLDQQFTDHERAHHCRVLTREMLDWYDGETSGKEPGTWAWLIGRYRHDEYSSLHDVQPSTRAQYVKVLNVIEASIGRVLLSETDFSRMMEWKLTMSRKGRSVSYISKWFRHLGLAISHGVKIGEADCVRIKTIRGEMRIAKPAGRTQYATREDIDKIVALADQMGNSQLALSTLFRFEFMLRGVDVYGEWEPAEGDTSGIMHGNRRWVKGLTWEMFDANLNFFEKVISKTAKSLPEAYKLDLRNTPDIRHRLQAIPAHQRIGPVIVMEDGLPPRADRMTKQFKAAVRACEGIPDNLRISDSRSGGITEARDMVEPMVLRNAAQHTQIGTTDRYVRGRSIDANNVVKLRGQR